MWRTPPRDAPRVRGVLLRSVRDDVLDELDEAGAQGAEGLDARRLEP